LAIHKGEIYGKRTANKVVMYNVLKVNNSSITLQNIDNLLSLFETTAQKLASSGYVLISQTPYVNTAARSKSSKTKSKNTTKISRCPYTLDFLESRADSERPTAVLPDLFTA